MPDQPVTKAELATALGQLKNELVEAMRDMQTELLRGFERFSAPVTTRMRKLEADQSNLDTATSPRLAQLEQQVTELTTRIIRLESKGGK